MNKPLDEFTERARKLASESSEGMREKLGSLQDSQEWQQARELVSDLAEDAADFVRKYPLQSLLGAAAAGLLLGIVLGKKGKE